MIIMCPNLCASPYLCFPLFPCLWLVCPRLMDLFWSISLYSYQICDLNSKQNPQKIGCQIFNHTCVNKNFSFEFRFEFYKNSERLIINKLLLVGNKLIESLTNNFFYIKYYYYYINDYASLQYSPNFLLVMLVYRTFIFYFYFVNKKYIF